MLFNSIHFCIFFPVVLILYFSLGHRHRWLFLLAAGSYFYMSFAPLYVIVPVAMIIMNYFAGIFIEDARRARRKIVFVATIVANVAVLVFFKYFNFVGSNANSLAEFMHWNYSIPLLNLILPLGLSFQTFQCIAYIIEVYRCNHDAEKHIGILGAYILFFPIQVAGPIERPGNLLNQLHERHEYDFERITQGLRLMVWGFFKKVVIADRVAIIVNSIYDHPHDHTGVPLILATFLFSIQIYCDFSGYSDIAIGAAKTMGFSLLTNFRQPYFSASISEFWQRWHITLSSWLRDYLFLPVTYSVARRLDSMKGIRLRIDYWGYAIGTMVAMFVAGLWHGASYTFVVWGLIIGLYMVVSRVTKKRRSRINRAIGMNRIPLAHRIFRICLTFSLISFAWIFFRANTLSESMYIVENLFNFQLASNAAFSKLGLTDIQLIVAALSIVIMFTIDFVQSSDSLLKLWENKPKWFEWLFWYAALFYLVNFGIFNNPSSFIYSQF
jgi:alginate O-acetyltransferase complex protein AlgI